MCTLVESVFPKFVHRGFYFMVPARGEERGNFTELKRAPENVNCSQLLDVFRKAGYVYFMQVMWGPKHFICHHNLLLNVLTQF